KATQLAAGAGRVNPSLGKCRRGPRAGSRNALGKPPVLLMRPQLAPRGGLVANNRLRLATLFLSIEPAADDDPTRPTRPDALFPRQPRWGCLPIQVQPALFDAAVAVRAAELRPIAGRQLDCRRALASSVAGRALVLRHKQFLRRWHPTPMHIGF